MRNEKKYLVPNDSYEKIYLAVKGLTASMKHVLRSPVVDIYVSWESSLVENVITMVVC